MKKTLLTMAAALALVGCSKSELVETPIQEQNAIAFGTYVGDNAQTRASEVTTETLGVDGFGVNAYYTGTKPFAEGAELNFMHNTKVTFNPDKGANGEWIYSPIKYWPNNTFVNDKGETQYEMVSFFAYGPYAKSPSDNNITQKGTSLDFVVANEVKNQVDLIYNTNYEGTIDQTKPSVEELIHFQFGHALSRISFTVEAAVDEVVKGNNLLDGNTRINVKKVALVSDKYNADANQQVGPFYTGGTLSLLEDDKDNPWSTRIPEDPQQGQGFVFNATDHFYHTVKDVDAETDNEIDVVQLTRFNASEPQRLLNDDSYLMVIPQENAEFKIYIEYDVISGGYENNGSGTYDESAITNKITSAEALTVTFDKGKAYKFNLVLGMTSVKVDASVDEWGDEIDGGDEWLPENEAEDAFAYANGEIQIKNAADLAKMRDLVNSGAKYYVNETGDGVVTVVESRAYTRSGDAEVKEYAKASYLQVADIDLSGIEWTPIGYRGQDDVWVPFKGSYRVAYNEEENSNYKIHNLTINSTAEGLDLGLFGYICGEVGTDAQLNGIWLENPNITGQNTVGTSRYTGGIVGYCQNVQILDCHIDGDENSIISDYEAGGLVGYVNDKLDIQHCTNHGVKVEGRIVGGICGTALSNTTVNSCYNYGPIKGRDSEDSHAGGIIGFCNSTITIENCSNHANVESTWTSGGIAGLFSSGSIIASWNTGSINGDSDAFLGGIVGWASDNSAITACYNTADAINTAGCAGGIVGLVTSNNINMTACYNTTTTFTNVTTYGGLVGNNVDNETTYTPTYSACYYLLTDNLTAWGYSDQDGEGVSKVGEGESNWNEPIEEMNKVLTGYTYTPNTGDDAAKTPATVGQTSEDLGAEEA